MSKSRSASTQEENSLPPPPGTVKSSGHSASETAHSLTRSLRSDAVAGAQLGDVFQMVMGLVSGLTGSKGSAAASFDPVALRHFLAAVLVQWEPQLEEEVKVLLDKLISALAK